MRSNAPGHPLSRRDLLKAGPAALLGLGLSPSSLAPDAAAVDLGPGVLPQEPLDIGETPQFLFDLYTVDSTWGLHEKQDLVRRFAGIYWGFLQAFRWNDFMHPQLAWSRDGINFQRMPDRPSLIDYGPDGSWDDTMLLACPNWIEVGDEWWIYYNGWDGFHETPERSASIGLATLRNEGFISLRGPAGGGVACTRSLRWPGGALAVNADAHAGELRVRVSDTFRKPIVGSDDDDCVPFAGDAVAHRLSWKEKPLDALKGRVIRLEFRLRDADLYTFRAVPAA
jgi:hypothetical protein